MHLLFCMYVFGSKNNWLKIFSNFEFQRLKEGKMLLIGIFNQFLVLLLGLIFSHSLQKKQSEEKLKYW